MRVYTAEVIILILGECFTLSEWTLFYAWFSAIILSKYHFAICFKWGATVMLTSDFSLLDCLWLIMCFQWLREGQLFLLTMLKRVIQIILIISIYIFLTLQLPDKSFLPLRSRKTHIFLLRNLEVVIVFRLCSQMVLFVVQPSMNIWPGWSGNVIYRTMLEQ